MDQKSFRAAMLCGLGRCCVELQTGGSGIEKHRRAVLWGCLHDFAFDAQCEGTRAALTEKYDALYAMRPKKRRAGVYDYRRNEYEMLAAALLRIGLPAFPEKLFVDIGALSVKDPHDSLDQFVTFMWEAENAFGYGKLMAELKSGRTTPFFPVGRRLRSRRTPPTHRP